MKFSLNNRLILETYKSDRGLKAVEKKGFAMVQQKISVKGLKVLVDLKLNDGTIIPKGSMAFIREELLHTMPWAQKVLESEGLEEQFIIVDLAHVEFLNTIES